RYQLISVLEYAPTPPFFCPRRTTMKNASLKVGQHLTLNNDLFEILRIKDEMYQLENQKDFSLRSQSKLQLHKALESGELKFSTSGNNLDDSAPVKGEARDLSSYSQ